jgi:phosphoserine phosphatase
MQHCWQEYRMVAARHGKAAAHSFLVQAFAGAKESELLALSREYFEQTLQRWLFSDAVQMLRILESNGVRCVVISASADFFVKGAAAVLPLAENRMHGIRLGLRDDGTLSHDVLAPVTSGEGKVGRMREVLNEMAADDPGRQFLPVMAIGDSLETDGAMLEAVARTPLPVGAPLSLIVNGGGSAASRGHRFREISFQSTLGVELVNL